MILFSRNFTLPLQNNNLQLVAFIKFRYFIVDDKSVKDYMKLKKSILLPSLVFLFLAILISTSWRSIQPSTYSHKNHRKKEKDHKKGSILSYKFEDLFNRVHASNPDLDSIVFKQAYIGYLNLLEQGKTTSSIITIADLSKHSSEPRLWIIDIEQDSVLLNTYVAHGRGSGLEEANSFSNRPNSNQSSLGFYLTGETYQGKHGRSLKLDGLDEGFNTNARARGIVMHGAWYVGQNILKGQDRMGVSQGCPAVAEILKDKIIDLIKDKSVLYIHGRSANYHSAFMNEKSATRSLMASTASDSELATDSALLSEVEGNLL